MPHQTSCRELQTQGARLIFGAPQFPRPSTTPYPGSPAPSLPYIFLSLSFTFRFYLYFSWGEQKNQEGERGPLFRLRDWAGGPPFSVHSPYFLHLKMMHEVLMALAGYPGDIFVRYEGEEASVAQGSPPLSGNGGPPRSYLEGNGCFRVNPLITTISSSEKESLERAVAPGYDILIVKEFIAAAETPGTSLVGALNEGPPLATLPFRGTLGPKTVISTIPSAASGPKTAAKSGGGGLYTAALARASRDIVNGYLASLLLAEEAALQQPEAPLSSLSLSLGEQPHRIRTLRHILSQVNPQP